MSSISGLWESIYLSTWVKYKYFNLHSDLMEINDNDTMTIIARKKRNQEEFSSL
jgi:hypothetical protein